MAINILDIQPSVISRDLRGKYICIYGPEKCGKTTFAAQQEKTLILAFEKGTNFLPNVFVQPIVTWSDFKLVLRQLKSKDAQEKYHCIAIDTVAEAYQLCEDFNRHAEIGERTTDLLIDQARFTLETAMKKAIAQGSVDVDERKLIGSLFASYQKNNGNFGIKDIFDIYKELPVKEIK